MKIKGERIRKDKAEKNAKRFTFFYENKLAII